MAEIIATITLKASDGVITKQLWASLTTLKAYIQPIALNAEGKGQVTLTKGTAYYLFYQFYGNPGDTIGVEITAGNRKLLELKESKIVDGKTYQAGVREFMP